MIKTNGATWKSNASNCKLVNNVEISYRKKQGIKLQRFVIFDSLDANVKLF